MTSRIRLPRIRARWWFPTVAVLLVLALVVAFRQTILISAGEYLDDSDAHVQADIGYILGGGRTTRADCAANLYRQGRIHRIVLPRASGLADIDGVKVLSEQEILYRMLVALGVAPDDIVELTEVSDSTEQEIQALAAYIHDHPGTTAAVITNDYHTRRCRLLVRRMFGSRADDVQIEGCASGAQSARTWWKSPEGFTAYLTEYLKLASDGLGL